MIAIPYSNALTCLDDSVANMGSMNNRPKVCVVHKPDFEWAQCDWPIARYPRYDTQAYHESFWIVASWYWGWSFHLWGRHQTWRPQKFANVSVSQTLGKFFKCRLRWAFAGHNNRPVWWSYGSRGVLETQFASIDTQDPSDLFSQVALEDHCVGDATHLILLSQYAHDKLQPNIQKSVTLLYESLPKTATAY